MKRPLATIGFTYLVTLVAAISFGINFSVVMAVFCAVLAVAAISIKRIRKGVAIPVALVTACIAFISFSGVTYFKIQPVQGLYDCQSYIYGVVAEEPYQQYGKNYLVIDTDNVEIREAPQNFRIRVSVESIDQVEIFDRVGVRVNFFEMPETSKEYQIAKGTQIYGYQTRDSSLQITKTNSYTVLKAIYGFRRDLINSIDQVLPKDLSAILRAVLTGDKTQISQDVKEDFSRTGLSHLLAVSGLHTSIICYAIFALLKGIGLSKRKSSLVSIAAILLFMVITGFTPSVTRAGIMTIIMMAGNLFNLEADSINSMGFACILICLNNPYAAADVGLQLSVTATLGILLLTPKLQKFFNFNKYILKLKNKYILKFLRGISASLSQTIGAAVFTLPIIIVNFKEFSVVSPIANLLAIQLFTLFMMTGAIAAMLKMTGFFAIISYPFSIVSFLVGKVILYIISFLSNLDFSVISASNDYIIIWICGTILLFALALFLRKNGSLFKLTAICSSVILLTGMFSYEIMNIGVTTVRIVDIENNCAISVTNGKESILIGAGGDSFDLNTINDSLLDSSITSISTIVLPELEEEFAGNAESIITKYTPKYVIAPYTGEYLDRVKSAAGEDKIYQIENAEFSPYKDSQIKILTDEDDNNWVILSVKSFNILFCPTNGDAQNLPDDICAFDIVILSSPIKNAGKISGSVFAVSSDAQTSAKIEQNLINAGAGNICRTAGNGDLEFKIRGNNYTVVRSV